MTILIQSHIGKDIYCGSPAAATTEKSRIQADSLPKSLASQGITQLALEVGVASFMQGNKSITENDSRPYLCAPRAKVDEGQNTYLERLAALVVTLLSVQDPQQIPVERSVTVQSDTFSDKRDLAEQVRAEPSISGSKAMTSSIPTFINVAGPMNLVAVSNILTKVLIDADRTATLQAAQASIRSVAAAQRSGEKTVESARRQLTGAISAGTLSSFGQGVTTLRSMKALGSESKSITHNLRPARNLELSATQQADSPSKGQGNRPSTKGISANRTPAEEMNASALKRDEHSAVQLKTAKVRLTTDYANQAIHSGKGLMEGAYNVSAATQQKEAELAKSDREINSELASTHHQLAKKNADAKLALSNTLDGLMTVNSNTFSAMADRT